MLSNLWPTQITVIDKDSEIIIHSVENAIQAMKFDYDDPRRQNAFKRSPLEAKDLGKEAECMFVYWDGRKIKFGSDEHHSLIEEFIWAKFEQYCDLQCRLVSTGDEPIVHRVGPPNPRTSLPNDLFVSILMDIRSAYQKEEEQLKCKT
jgi:predicted NAD-dependent protein-ADP-ribosyltransferase YbiA (DUF1768 family)